MHFQQQCKDAEGKTQLKLSHAELHSADTVSYYTECITWHYHHSDVSSINQWMKAVSSAVSSTLPITSVFPVNLGSLDHPLFSFSLFRNRTSADVGHVFTSRMLFLTPNKQCQALNWTQQTGKTTQWTSSVLHRMPDSITSEVLLPLCQLHNASSRV